MTGATIKDVIAVAVITALMVAGSWLVHTFIGVSR